MFFRNRINDAITQLTENGDLGRLENKWWLDECGYEAKVSLAEITDLESRRIMAKRIETLI